MSFCVISHTADVALDISATTKPKLFEEAAKGYQYLLLENQECHPLEDYIIQLEGNDHESLLVKWLSELAYIFETKQQIACDFKVLALKNNHLRAKVGFAPYDPKMHSIQKDVKAVTYSDLKIEKTSKGFKTRIVFDI
ncbi:MAG: archease [Deltaproteobacteria bacterium]|nr:archease [Deltaproteobacteria bacterium]